MLSVAVLLGREKEGVFLLQIHLKTFKYKISVCIYYLLLIIPLIEVDLLILVTPRFNTRDYCRNTKRNWN